MNLLTYITWAADPTLFEIGPLTIRWYGLLFALGFIIGQRILTHVYLAEGRRAEDVDIITIYMIVGTVVGARLGHCLFYDPEYYLSHPLDILKVWEGGLASHGATIGILFALYLFSRKYHFSYLWVLDRIVIVVALGGSFIRLGNLMNSEIVGRPTDLPWAFLFVNNHEYAQVPRHPAQLYESISSFLLFVVLYLIWRKYKANLPLGLLFGLFVVVLFTMRFFYEFLKENQVDFENALPLNMGQFLSIPFVLVGLVILYRSFSNRGYRNFL